MTLPAVPLRLTCLAPNRHARTSTDVAIDQAIIRTLHADAPAFERLPVPVRYRAAGAIQAWSAARRAAGREGDRLTAMLADPHYPPLLLVNHLADFVERHSTIDYKTRDGRVVAQHGNTSIYWQAFWERAGALYEPTWALHRLLDATDIADNVPLRMLRPPASALCIVPDPSTWSTQGGVQAIAVFTHAAVGESAANRSLTLVAWSKWTDPQPSNGIEVLTIPADDEDRPIGESLELALDKPSLFADALSSMELSREENRRRWRSTLNYVVKMLLYLSLDSTQVLHERPFSTAVRVFPGLGKRKRELRLAQVDQLYDRYVVGPAVLADELVRETDGTSGHGKCAHWRRGHFRMQPYGPQASLRKLLFIAPMLVRADQLPIREEGT